MSKQKKPSAGAAIAPALLEQAKGYAAQAKAYQERREATKAAAEALARLKALGASATEADRRAYVEALGKLPAWERRERP